jgi:NADPH-dependent glutamate synthase beta subunit-like oxidoreductase
MSRTSITTQTQALAEAWRCLQCFDAPCIAACPANVHIPRFIRMIRSGNLAGASEELRSANALITLCGTVCPSSVLCRSHCTRGRVDNSIRIGDLHQFVTASVKAKSFPDWPKLKDARVAVVGAGPAGLGCALALAQREINVTIFEKNKRIGGIPALEIPQTRTEDSLEQDLNTFASRLKIVTSKSIRSLKDLSEFDAVFVAVGLGKSVRLGIEGEELDGVETASSFLRRARESVLDLKDEKVIVVGGGNTAMDAALVARQAGADVAVVYRRRHVDLPAWEEEVEDVAAKGVVIRFLENPIRILGKKGRVKAVDLKRQIPGEIDASGRPKPIPVDAPPIRLDATRVIVAIGARVSETVLPEIPRSNTGWLIHNENSTPRVYVGGDAAHGEGTIVGAFAEGRRVAEDIIRYLKEGK